MLEEVRPSKTVSDKVALQKEASALWKGVKNVPEQYRALLTDLKSKSAAKKAKHAARWAGFIASKPKAGELHEFCFYVQFETSR